MSTQAGTPSPLLAAALAWHDAGYSVVPSHEDGGKRPFGPWWQYQRTAPTRDDLGAWLTTGRYTGIGVICGTVSGGVEMLEVEGHAVAAGALDTVRAVAQAAGLLPLWERAVAGCSEQSPSGGLHIFVRVTDGTALGNTKLAHSIDPATGRAGKVIAETRGEGGFVVVAPTTARLGHKAGSGYAFLPRSTPAATATVTSAERDQLHRLLACLDTAPPAAAPRDTPAAPRPERDRRSPGDHYAAATTWGDLLEPAGWARVYDYTRDGHPSTAWRRPGKNDGISATTGGPGDHLYVFTTSTTLPTGTPLTKLYVYAHLHHSDDMRAAARQLAHDGYGDTTPTRDLPPWEPPVAIAAPPQTPPAPQDGDQEQEDADGATWADLTWLLTGERHDPPPPLWLTIAQDRHLFYAGRINGLFGDPETAKSWIAMCALVEALAERERCAYLDVDHNGATEIASRLLALGADPARVADPDLFRVYEPETGYGLVAFVAQMREWHPVVVVVDSLGEILPMLGLKSTDNDDITKAIRGVLKPLAHDVGAAVIAIDHLPKGTEARQSGYAIGGTAKKRATDGTYMSCEAISPPAPGQVGRIRLTVEKDRHGHVRAHAVGRLAGDFILDSTDPAAISWRIEVPAAGIGGKPKPTGAMEAVSRWLEANGMHAESRQVVVKALVEAGPFKKHTIESALDQLAQDGYLSVDSGRRGAAHAVHLSGAFRELGDLS